MNELAESFSNILRKIYLLPYSLFSMVLVQFIFFIFGLVVGGKFYILISVSVFGLHLITRKIIKRRFDYPLIFSVRRGSAFQLEKPLLSSIMLSFVLSVFIVSAIGVIKADIEVFVLKILGLMMYYILLLGLIAFPFIIFSRGIQNRRDTRTVSSTILVVILLDVFILYWLVNINHIAILDNRLYASLITLLFSTPSLYVAKMLFYGFTDDDHKTIFLDLRNSFKMPI